MVLACWCMLTWASRQMRSEFQKQIDTISAAGRVLEGTPTEEAAVAAVPTTSGIAKIELVTARPTAPSPAISPSAPGDSSEIPPEAEAAIKATLTAFLGHKVRIRSVKLLADPDAATTWATQGRVAVQTSHNQRSSRT